MGRGTENVTLWGMDPPPRVRLTVDAPALGLDPERVRVRELIEGARVSVTGEAGRLVLDVPMLKDMARVITLLRVEAE